MAGRKRKIEEDDETGSHTLYIQNLNDQINAKTLKHHLYLNFSTYGDVIDIVIKAHSKKMRGQAHVIFANKAQSANAMKALQNEEFFDKSLRLSYAINKSRIIDAAEKEDESKESNTLSYSKDS